MMTKIPEAFIRIGVNTTRHKTITVDDFNGDQAAFLAYGMISSIWKPLYSEEYLAQPEQSEPVAIVELVTQALRAMPDGTWGQQEPQLEIRAIRPVVNGQRLYTAPPLRELSAEEVKLIIDKVWATSRGNTVGWYADQLEFAKAVLAAARSIK